MAEEIYIIGFGGLGHEIAAGLSHPFLQKKFIRKGFIDDIQPPAKDINGIPIPGNLDWLIEQQNTNAIIAVANISVRITITKRLSGSEILCPAIIHPGARIYSPNFVSIGTGCYIADGCILTTHIRIGEYALILSDVILSSDTIIGDFCTIMTGVRISGGATIGNEVFIGQDTVITGPITIKDGTVIPSGTIIG
jgi:acetyltransferase-like isoleucine patch superfamily enzyme